jgi:hypothetical protein
VTPSGSTGQPYDIAFTPEAQRQLSRLPGKIVAAVPQGRSSE